jgi:hypothetical protein
MLGKREYALSTSLVKHITGERRQARRSRAISSTGLGLPYMSGLTGIGEYTPTPETPTGSISHPIFGGEQLNYSVMQVPDCPDGQVTATIGLMCKYAMEDSQSPEIQREALAIYQMCSRHGLVDKGMVVRQVWHDTQQKIKFLRDEATAQPLESFLSKTYAGAPVVEILIRPRDMANLHGTRAGDCDDYSMYAAALLTALSIPCSFVTIAGDPQDPGHFTHVYVAAYPDGHQGERVAVDASHGKWCGWEGWKRGMRKKEWRVDGMGVGIEDGVLGGVLGTVVFVGAAMVGFAWLLR